ncbi:pyridoxal phosphate-dependent decarboxylase family protein [Actinospongicola halichondriae]|uniref:pyridoxal phosphate-dependent decarboxylase family protein n=1 Tax=Actinospongicola halichondriae TaxID=3236844 RepID=UPI003D50F5F7
MADRNFPYAETFEVNRTFPEKGRSTDDVLAEIRHMADAERVNWNTGQASGTLYSGDEEHYDFMAEAFGMFGHMNSLQRDLCPSATKFEGEIIAMTLDMLGAGTVTDAEPAGLVTTGGTGSICHAMLAYRIAGAERGVTQPNVVKAATGHPAFDKACFLFGIEMRVAPIDPDTTQVDVAAMADMVDDQTIAIIGSAGNYPYGTIDDIEAMSDLALERGIGLHVDGCLGGFILPWGRDLGYDIPPFDFSLPGVTTISADTHKYGYGFKGTSVAAFRDKEMRNSVFYCLPEWTGGKYNSPGIDGSRSGGLLAATWAALVGLGKEGYREYADQIFKTSYAMQDAVTSHPELRLMGSPTFCFSFTSDDLDIYHVNDHLQSLGWRLNGQQYPDAVHMSVTRPQTAPGVLDRWETDLAAAIAYAKEQPADAKPLTGAIYGGVEGGLTDEADDFIREQLTKYIERTLALPRVG